MNGLQLNFWAIIILLGAVQGFFLCAYLFTKKENRAANKWLAFLLAAVSLHLTEYAADITGLTLRYPLFIAITYPLLFLMGPFYYLYCRKLLEKPGVLPYKPALHFIPALVVLLLMLPFYLMEGEAKVNSLKALVKNGILKIPAEQLIFMGAHVAQTVVYIFAAHKFTTSKEKELKEYSSDVLIAKKLHWLNTFSKFFSLYFLLYFLLVVGLVFMNKYQVQLDYVLLLIMSASMYAIGYSAISNPEIFKEVPFAGFLQAPANRTAPEAASETQSRFPDLKQQLLRCMELNKPYLQSDLKISDLAGLLSIPAYQLSELINREFLVNFYDFINKYRVEEAKQLLLKDTRNYKVLSIAFEAGFNSKATFNRVFKKFTGLTPSTFKSTYTSGGIS